jgi:phage terminase large subunit-like protein
MGISLLRLHNLITKLTVEKYCEPPQFHNEILKLYQNDDRLQSIIAPVGFAKSSTIKSYIIYNILTDIKFQLYVSSTATKVERQFTGLKFVLKNPFFQKLFNYKIIVENVNEIVININGKNRCIAGVSVDSEIAGISFENQRPEIITIDDVEELKQARNLYQTQKLFELIDLSLISRLPSVVDGKVRMIGTNLTKFSIINQILTNQLKGWKGYLFIALKDGKSIWEDKHPTKDLLEEQERRPKTFASNYMGKPFDDSKGFIQIEDLKYYDILNVEIKALGCHADLSQQTTDSFKKGRLPDFFCIGLIGLGTNNEIYLLDYILDRLKIEDQADAIIQFYLRNKYRGSFDVTYDAISQASFEPLIRQKALNLDLSLPIKPVKYNKDKVTHFEPYEVDFRSKRVNLPLHNRYKDVAEYQLLQFPFGENDDFVDMWSGACDNLYLKQPYKPKTIEQIRQEFNKKV